MRIPLKDAAGRRLKALPETPGVYLFTDRAGNILYVGKAASLRKRVASYFQREPRVGPRIARMLPHIHEVQVRTTASEAEALLLEAQLIKTHQPRYNVAYRDDKSYPLLKLTNERFPRLLVTRKRQPDLPAPPLGGAQAGGARYFGPYTDAGALHLALAFLRRVFPLRSCRAFPDSPCLEYHLGQCLAPCVGQIDEPAYQRIVEDLVAFLEGKRDALLHELSRRMRQASRDQRFEEAARIRDQIQALSSIIVAKERSALAGPLEQLQHVLRLPQPPRRIEAFDISNLFGQEAVGSMVTFADGKPLKAHYRHFRIKTVRGIDDYQMMREVIRRRYGGTLSEELPLPELVVVDGGKGQLSAALDELAALGRSIPAMGLAKQFEHVFLPRTSEPIVLLPTSPVLHLVQRIRDEAHRFAVTYHRRLRGKQVSQSALDALPGIGPKRKAALLEHFGSVDRLSQADPADVARVARISERQAKELIENLVRDQR